MPDSAFLSDMREIRQAQSDGERVAALAIQSAVFVREQAIPEHMTLDGDNAGAMHVIAFDGDEPVGTARINVCGNGRTRVGTIARVAVLPPYRGEGLGRKMIREAESLGVAQQVSEFILRPHTHLQPYYEALGYLRVPDGDHVVAGHLLVTMCKKI